MREIASFEDERTARRFADVLCARSIDAEISEGRSGTFSVWVLVEAQVEPSRAAFAAFDANPDAGEFLAAAGCTEKKQQAAQAEARRSRHEVIDVRTTWDGGAVRPARVTSALVATSIAVTLATLVAKRQDVALWLSIGTPDELVRGALWHVLHGEVWRLVTPIFMHFSFLHIFFNLWWLIDLGGAIERRLGPWRLLGIVMVSAALSNIAQYLIHGSVHFGGMSGVVYALLGYIWVRGRMDLAFGMALQTSTIVVLLVWLVLGFTGSIGNIANYAHLGGLVVGAALGLVGALRARR